MFGFGKKRKVRNQFESFLNAVLGTYMLMRSVGSFKMEEANLDPLALQMFEISYILGVIDALAHAVDLDGKIIGEEDGSFDSNDYILFNASGPNGYSPENNTNLNLYEDKITSFLSVGLEDGLRISDIVEPVGETSFLIDY